MRSHDRWKGRGRRLRGPGENVGYQDGNEDDLSTEEGVSKEEESPSNASDKTSRVARNAPGLEGILEVLDHVLDEIDEVRDKVVCGFLSGSFFLTSGGGGKGRASNLWLSKLTLPQFPGFVAILAREPVTRGRLRTDVIR